MAEMRWRRHIDPTIDKMFRSKPFSARPVYFLSIVKSRPEIAMDLCHGKKDAYLPKKILEFF
jgi:hypothetical protein